VNLAAVTSSLVTGQSTGLTANFLTNSNGGAVSLSDLTVLLGLPVTWSAAGGALSGEQATVQASGTATANYQATAVAAGNKAVAKIDNDGTVSGSNVAVFTVNKANTTATITGTTPDPSLVGENVTISYNVTVDAPGAGTPTGNVTISDGDTSCTATVAAGSCTIAFASTGAKNLNATYVGSDSFNGSVSAPASHTVNSPTAVTLLDFSLLPMDAVTLAVEWSTASELNTYGFHLWRSENADRSQAVRITPEMVEPQGDLLFGAEYLFVDGPLQPETEYTYWLQEISANGDTEYGPVTARTPAHAATEPDGFDRLYLPLLNR
jgi:hypothetical protein